jgi:alginate O-acetyltransferase complex protein AlgI
MLFNSYPFIFVFLPITLIIFCLLGRTRHPRAAVMWLVAASLIFYGWSNPAHVGLILGSILFNYALAYRLSNSRKGRRAAKIVLSIGIAANLLLLGYFKYTNFIIFNINEILGSEKPLLQLTLPLGISFLTFQQIAYLVDAYRGEVGKFKFLEYCLFATFFPKLIAGPILLHQEVLPQLSENQTFRCSLHNLAVGFSVFSLGLFKKVVLGDGIGAYAKTAFDAAAGGTELTFFAAWTGVLAYTFQIYFDFSGYSDMAIGLGWLFGIRLPVKFNSPYTADNVIDFWRRWHITLSRFLRMYIYIPLGGSRRGPSRRYLNLLFTMLLCGLWHGANWTFIVWGGIHGIYLIINHLWKKTGFYCSRTIGWFLTFLAVSYAWVFFNANTIETAFRMSRSLLGLNGVIPHGLLDLKPFPVNEELADVFRSLDLYVTFWGGKVYIMDIVLSGPVLAFVWLSAATVIVLALPNSLEWAGIINGTPYKFSARRAIVVAFLLFLTILGSISIIPSTFIYSQF